MFLRKTLLLLLVLICAANVLSRADEIHPAPKSCPPADGYAWTKARSVERVLWVQVKTEQQFRQHCESQQFACAHRYQDVLIVYARNPREFYSEAQQLHEDCHASHDHGEPPIHSLLR